MTRKIFLFFSLLAVVFSARSASVTLREAGTLGSALEENPADVTELTLSGRIDVRDLEFISSQMPKLRTLNLAGASICSLKGHRSPTTGQNQFRSNVLPPMSLCDLPATSIVLPSTLREIGQGALGGTKAKTIVIPEGTRTIAAGAFAGSTALESITIPTSVTAIGIGAFKGCQNLKTVQASITKIPDHCFADCPNLATVTLGSVSQIGRSAFADCVKLETISLDATSLTEIGAEAFRNTALETLDLSKAKGIYNIGAWAFANNPLLANLLLPMEVGTIGRGYCFNNSDLTTFIAPELPKVIPAAAYKGCVSLNYMRMLGQKAETVEPYAFYCMESLDTLYLPATLRHLDREAMAGMTGLKQMEAPGLMDVPTLGENVWGEIDRSKVKLGVAKDMMDAFKSTPVWQDFNIVDAAIINDPGVGGITAPEAVEGRGKLLCRMAGDLLTVTTSDGAPLERVMIYDLQGRLLLNHDAGQATETVINTARWASTRLFMTTAARGRSAKVAR